MRRAASVTSGPTGIAGRGLYLVALGCGALPCATGCGALAIGADPESALGAATTAPPGAATAISTAPIAPKHATEERVPEPAPVPASDGVPDVHPRAASATAPEGNCTLALALDADELALPPGECHVTVAVPPNRLVTIGVIGLRHGLERLALEAPYAALSGATPEDGYLPRFVSFTSGALAAPLGMTLALDAPAVLLRRTLELEHPDPAPARWELARGLTHARPLVGMPFPLDAASGYVLGSPHRYQFARHDVALALRGALEQTRTRFRRNALALHDLSQWDGNRPASDDALPRHIGHTGGREVDVGLPASDESASNFTTRCTAVMVDREVLKCGPGTVKNFDALRLGYFLGLLIDGPTPDGRYMPDKRPGPIAPVEYILTDQVYIDAVRKALPELKKRFWIHDDAFGALMEEGILRASPWHVDHVHVRFAGEEGEPLVPTAPSARVTGSEMPWRLGLGP